MRADDFVKESRAMQADNPRGQHPCFPRRPWATELESSKTSLGYWPWVERALCELVAECNEIRENEWNEWDREDDELEEFQ